MAQQKLEPDKKKNVRNKWTPDIIIDKSKEIFREKGFELSMHDIAREREKHRKSADDLPVTPLPLGPAARGRQ